jgi:hypothetical protein
VCTDRAVRGRGPGLRCFYATSIPEWLTGWSARNGCMDSTTTAARTVWAGCDAALEHFAVVGAGHDYPAESADAVWEFFTRQGM